MINSDDLKVLDVLNSISKKFSYEAICKLSEEQKVNYKILLNNLCRSNSADVSNKEKGDALEDVAKFLLETSGGIFNVERNIRTTTNELDLFIELNEKGRVLLEFGILPSHYHSFICECKNHNKVASVTYVGKFCSLMQTCQIKLGLLFTYKGISGTGWANASGLVKKFYLSKEDVSKRFCVVDLTWSDYIKIRDGENLLRIIDSKIKSMQLDTDYTQHLSKHELESK